MKSIVSSLFLFFCCIAPVKAEPDNRGFCQKATTTADLMECIGTHYKAQTDHMTELYQTLIKLADKDEAFKANLDTNQKEWLAYRDSLCNLEGLLYEGGSLERVQQLHCLANATAERNSHLTILTEGFNPDDIPVFASPPRWVNVLLHDYPDIYWAVGKAQSVDTDCDGVDEQVVQGLNPTDNTESLSAFVAIADSEQTGRPTISLLQFTDEKACPLTAIPVFNSFEVASDGESDQQGEKKCKFSVVRDNEACAVSMLEYDAVSKQYKLENKDTAE